VRSPSAYFRPHTSRKLGSQVDHTVHILFMIYPNLSPTPAFHDSLAQARRLCERDVAVSRIEFTAVDERRHSRVKQPRCDAEPAERRWDKQAGNAECRGLRFWVAEQTSIDVDRDERCGQRGQKRMICDIIGAQERHGGANTLGNNTASNRFPRRRCCRWEEEEVNLGGTEDVGAQRRGREVKTNCLQQDSNLFPILFRRLGGNEDEVNSSSPLIQPCRRHQQARRQCVPSGPPLV
jgi:hypothetical protein